MSGHQVQLIHFWEELVLQVLQVLVGQLVQRVLDLQVQQALQVQLV